MTLARVVNRGRAFAIALGLACGLRNAALADRVTVQYDLRVSCLLRLETDFMNPQDVGLAFLDLSGRISYLRIIKHLSDALSRGGNKKKNIVLLKDLDDSP